MAWITVIVAAADGRSIERRRERGEGGCGAKQRCKKQEKVFHSTADRMRLPSILKNPSLPPFLSRCAIAEPADRIACEVKVLGANSKLPKVAS